MGLLIDMLSTCSHAIHMSKMVQIRSVPDDIHRSLRMKAIRAGTSLSEFLLTEITHVANRPSIEELLAHLSRRRRPGGKIDSARLVREMREDRR
jgi:plasmid stability protein